MYSLPKWVKHLVGVLFLAAICAPSWATTKGLNQIVTPDVQPEGLLSVSFQGENPAVGNSEQMQFELGLTKNFEAAVFQGFSPGATVLNAELGLVKTPSFLLSTGLLGLQNKVKSQPFLEGGYYRGKGFFIAGVQDQNSAALPVLGAGYQSSAKLLIAVDYVGGESNFSTAGITYTFSPTLSFNPAIYVSNSSPHRVYGYGVLTWSRKLW